MNSAIERNHGLDLIRGLAAVGIAIYHFLAWNYSLTLHSLGTFGVYLHSLGTFGVYLFFILSALTMLMRYENVFRDTIQAADLIAFYRNRVARLVPLLALVSILSAHWWLGRGNAVSEQAARVLLTATGAMGLHLPGYISNATGAWSLGIEAAFYVVFPLVALLCARATVTQCAIMVAILVLFQQATLFLISDLPDTQFWHYYITPVTFAPFFGLGVLIFKAPLKVRAAHLWVSLVAMGALAVYTQIFSVMLWYSPVHYQAVTGIAAAVVAFAYRSTMPKWLGGGRSSWAISAMRSISPTGSRTALRRLSFMSTAHLRSSNR